LKVGDEVAEFANEDEGCSQVDLVSGGRGEERVVDEVRDVESSQPVVCTVPGEIGEERHGTMAEPVHVRGLENSLGVVNNPADEGDLLSELDLWWSRVKMALEKIKDWVNEQWSKVFNDVSRSVANLHS